jgi:hypothetical protein
MSMQNVESYPYRHVKLTKSKIDTCIVQLKAHVLLLTTHCSTPHILSLPLHQPNKITQQFHDVPLQTS